MDLAMAIIMSVSTMEVIMEITTQATEMETKTVVIILVIIMAAKMDSITKDYIMGI